MFNSTGIVVVDDHQVLRQGLCRLLDGMPGFKVLGEAGNGQEAVEKVAQLHPSVVVMDLNMPEMDGIEATRQITQAAPNAKVVVLSQHGDRTHVPKAMEAGASGFVLKECAFEELKDAIRQAEVGKLYLSPKLASQPGMTEPAEPVGATPQTVPLSAPATNGSKCPLSVRERQVLTLLANGRATKEVAADLGISIKTAETHRRQIMEKLQLDGIAQLTKYAIREGFASLDDAGMQMN